MSNLDDPIDPPKGWKRDHLDRYVATGGRNGHIWRGVPTLLLTTRGSRSGKPRRTPLIYGRDGDRVFVVASKGGSETPPSWYTNLQADPAVRVQIADRVFDATARTANADEKPLLWKTMAGIWPDYDVYQTKTNREIPVVILDPVPTR